MLDINSSQLAKIEPTEKLIVRRKQSMHTVRSGGSFIQLLKKPTRYLESFRSYTPGDPVEFIDWKVFARTEKLIIKQWTDRSSSHVLIRLDNCPTMNWPDQEIYKITKAALPAKYEVAARVALVLAYNHLVEGDSVDLALGMSNEGNGKLVRFSSQAEVLGLFRSLVTERFSEDVIDKYAVDMDRVRQRKYRIEYVLSDFIEFDFARLATESTHKLALQIMSRLEVDTHWAGNEQKFKISPTINTEIDSKTISEQYAKKFNVWKGRVRENCKNHGYVHVLLDDSLPSRNVVSKLMEAI